MTSKVIVLHSIGSSPNLIGPYAGNLITAETLEDLLSKFSWGDFKHRESAPSNYITFDDGLGTVLEQALPLLETNNVPAIIFITTEFINGNSFPYEIDLANLMFEKRVIKLKDGNAIKAEEFSDKEKIYLKLRNEIRNWSPTRQRAFVNNLSEINNYQFPRRKQDKFLSWDEIATLDKHPLIAIGSHTLNHPVLPCLSPIAAFWEIKKSKTVLERKLGHTVEYFAYPYGAQNRITRNLVRLAGYKYAFTTQKESVGDWKIVDPMVIPRLAPVDISG